jgi:hypothetical protein
MAYPPSHWYQVLALGGVALVLGCAPKSDQWAISEVHPAGAPFPFSGVRLDRDGNYETHGLFNEHGEYTGRTQAIDGKYSWAGGKLSMMPKSGPTVTYRTRRRIDGSLMMTLDIPGQEKKIRAVMRPVPRIESDKT